MRPTSIFTLVLGLVLGLTPLRAKAVDNSAPNDFCKISQVDLKNPMRVGWPKYPGLLPPQGNPQFLIVGIDFTDSPFEKYSTEQLKDILEVHNVVERYKYVSDDIFVPSFSVYPDWIRMPEPSTHYGQNKNRVEIVSEEWSSHHIAHDVTNILKEKSALRGYDGLIIFVSGGSALSGLAAYSTVLDSEISASNQALSHYIVLGREWEDKKDVDLWRVIVHEMNHLLGLADLYLYDPDGYWKGRTPGPFGQQAYVYNSSSDSIGWNRWLNGWTPDQRITCLDKPTKVEKLYLGSDYGMNQIAKELLVTKLSETKVLVVESLHARGFASITYDNSVLVYTVDSSVKIGEGPVNIIPRPTKLTLAPLSPDLPDWIRFQEAPLIPDSYVEYQDILIVNEKKMNLGSIISIYLGAERAAIKSKIDALNSKNKKSSFIRCKKNKSIKVISKPPLKCPKGYVKITK